MRRFLRADYYFDNIYQITIEFLKELSITALIADLDNTIADYDTLDPTPEIISWIDGVHSAGIKLAIVSNNKRERVERFCKKLDIPHYWKSGKPGKKTILRAVEVLGCDRANVAMLGDKLSTDVLGARFSGITMLKVRSIKPRWKRSFKK